MKIGIISDSHAKVEAATEAIDMLKNQGAEFFIHAGDIVYIETLEYLKKRAKKYVAVYGNNDAHLIAEHKKFNLVQEPYYFKLSGCSLKLMHLPFYLSPDAEVVIYGHTHVHEIHMQNGTLFLNPGEICGRKKPLTEAIMLTIAPQSFEVQRFYKKIGAKGEYEEEKFTFIREKNEKR